MERDGFPDESALEEQNDKIRRAAEHLPLPQRTGITTGRAGESDQVTVNGMILFVGAVGLGGLATVLASIFIFAFLYPRW